MPKRIFIKDGGLTSSRPIPSGYTVLGSNNGTPKKQIQSTISDLGGFTHYIGEEFGGGVIFHLWKNPQGIEQGLIVDLNDLGLNIWSNVINPSIGSAAQSFWDGLSNSNAIVSQAGHTNSAAKACLDSNNGGYNDWYLPALDELRLLYNNRFNVNITLSSISGASIFNFITFQESIYLTSTEYSLFNDTNLVLNFIDGSSNAYGKDEVYNVRAIRKFTI